MIEKREDNPSIAGKGLHESVSTISLENVDQYLKQLEAQKLNAQYEISNTFRGLSEILLAREKQLLRQVDAMHDHLILFLQSRKSLFNANLNCCNNGNDSFELTSQNNSSIDNQSVKASPGIEVSLNATDLEKQIQVFGKVEMTGANYMHLSEDNESFTFPYRVQNYQETREDHMLLYKSLDVGDDGDHSVSVAEVVNFERPVVDMDKETKGTDNLVPNIEAESTCENQMPHQISASTQLEENTLVESGMDSKKILKQETKEDDKDRGVMKSDIREVEERPEDVRHWMREILSETNPEPASNDPDPGRFDLFTVLKNRNLEEASHEKTIESILEEQLSCFSESSVLSGKDSEFKSQINLMVQECPLAEAESLEGYLID